MYIYIYVSLRRAKVASRSNSKLSGSAQGTVGGCIEGGRADEAPAKVPPAFAHIHMYIYIYHHLFVYICVAYNCVKHNLRNINVILCKMHIQIGYVGMGQSSLQSSC